MSQISIRRGVPKRVRITLTRNPDVSQDVITGEIRAAPDRRSKLLANWNVSYLNDGKDGELLLSLDESTKGISKDEGYMYIRRSICGGEPENVFDEPLEVSFE